MKDLLKDFKIGLIMTASLALILCGIYPALVWGIGQAGLKAKADGSLVSSQGRTVGSELIAQPFGGPAYFHPRPSAVDYNAEASGASNLGPLSKKLSDSVAARVRAYRAENGLKPEAVVPADAVTASGSGLDPHISLANARLQLARVAAARGLGEQSVAQLMARCTEGRQLGVLGEERVNVLKLNLALDGLTK